MTVDAAIALPPPFAWRGDHIHAPLGHGAEVLFTTRRGGVSEPPYATLNLGPWTDDDPAAVAENRERVRPEGTRLAQAHQVHGADVRHGDEGDGDAQVTRDVDVAPIVLTADCLPIALATPDAVAMVHAGWKGLAAGVVENAVAALGDGAFVAAIGPSARGCCYEVGDEVREAFGIAAVGGPATIDLAAIARERLDRLGAAAVHDVDLCTMCTDPSLFFSHRRDGGRTGRQAGIAWRSSSTG